MDARWLHDLEREAEAALPAPVFHYFSQGAREGLSAAEATAAWRRVRFVPRVLRDVSRVSLETTLLGHSVQVPFGVAPTTLQRAAHPEGELAMAAATAAAGSVMVVSSNAGTPFSEIAATGVHWWLQAYLPQDRGLARDLLGAAVASGARAVVLTVDTPVVGTKYDEGPTIWQTTSPDLLRVNFPPGYDDLPGSAKATDLGPGDVAWIRELTGLPVVVKGVLHPDDAQPCLDAGASALWVSNHGGRQLDRSVATAEALPRIREAVGDAASVYVDGGLRCGLDVVAALALGADFVFLGRLPLYALVSGEPGVRRMHREMALQTGEALRLLGAPSPADARANGGAQPSQGF